MAHAWWHPNKRNWGKMPQALTEEEKALNKALGVESTKKVLSGEFPDWMRFSFRDNESDDAEGQRILEARRRGALPTIFSSQGSMPYRTPPSSISSVKPDYRLNSRVVTSNFVNPTEVNKPRPEEFSEFPIGSGITQARVGSNNSLDNPVEQKSPFSKSFIKQLTEESTPENQRNLDRKVMSPFAFMPNPDSASEVVETQETKPSLWETWGSLADDSKKRKEAYLGSIKNIFMKKMLLDGIATLTGGKSQGDQWSTMAIAELDAIEKFDAEERTHNQWKALFFTEDGVYSPPANRKEALERGQQLGYDASQMKDILTVFPKEDDDRTTLEKKVAYIQTLAPGPLRDALEREVLGMGVEDKKTNLQKEIDYMVETFNISPEEAERQARISVGLEPRASKESRSAIEKRIESALASGAITPEEADLARRVDLLGGKEGSDKSYSARGKMVSIYLKDSSVIDRSNRRRPDAPSFAEWIRMPKNKASYDILLSGDMSFTSGNSAPRQTAPQSALDYLKKNPSQAQNFKDKYGYLPEGY